MDKTISSSRRHDLAAYLFLAPYLTLFAVFILLPFVYSLLLSLFRWEMVSLTPPRFIGWGNYAEALHSDYFWKAMWVTFKFVIMLAPMMLLLSLLAALGINACGAFRQPIYRAAYFIPALISVSVAGILWRWFYNTDFGLFNAYLSELGWRIPWITSSKLAIVSIVLMTLWWGIGGTTIILIAGLQGIPDSYYEAAAIDGAGRIHQFFYITLPQLRPILLFITVMNIIGSFQVFGQTFMITGGGPELSTRTMVQYIYETAFTNYRMGYGSAMSWLLFVVIGIFAVMQFRILKEQ
ncbi:sugar ABC transporter permease [Candidatus Sumerlaeota bacterium]|nr:sugar ABC transporter permease [Candidatus Sumerlaeota bacterium]